jgi:hypothetical protein
MIKPVNAPGPVSAPGAAPASKQKAQPKPEKTPVTKAIATKTWPASSLSRPATGPGGSNQGPGNQKSGPGSQSPYSRQYNRGPNSGGPFGGDNFFDKFGFGPFSKGGGAPWEKWPFGGKDSFWSRKESPFNNQNPSDWFQPEDPKEGLAIMWDDLISAPDDIGTMPGGWYVPSVSVPNPVDLEDQFEKASKEVPDLIRIYTD